MVGGLWDVIAKNGWFYNCGIGIWWWEGNSGRKLSSMTKMEKFRYRNRQKFYKRLIFSTSYT